MQLLTLGSHHLLNYLHLRPTSTKRAAAMFCILHLFQCKVIVIFSSHTGRIDKLYTLTLQLRIEKMLKYELVQPPLQNVDLSHLISVLENHMSVVIWSKTKKNFVKYILKAKKFEIIRTITKRTLGYSFGRTAYQLQYSTLQRTTVAL